MTSLEELRTQLSDVDDQITDLYEKRMKICEDLGTCKIKNGYKTCLLYTSPSPRDRG